MKPTVVYKYIIPSHGGRVEMPEGAKILSVGCQGPKLVAWALVNHEAPKVWRNLIVVGTGWPLDEVFALRDIRQLGDFIGTAVDQFGLVFHVFDNGIS